MITGQNIIFISSIEWDFLWKGHQEIAIRLARAANLNFPLRPLLRPFLLGVIAYSIGLGALLLGVPQLLAIILALLVFSFDIRRVAQSILRQSRPVKP